MKHYTNHASGHLGWARGLVKQGMGWMGALRWPRQASKQAQAPLFHNNKEPHWSMLRPCNPRGHRGPQAWDKWTQMLPANAEQAHWELEGGGVGGRDRKRGGLLIFFLPLVEAVIFLIPVLSHNHRSQRPPCKTCSGEIIRGSFVFEG